MGRPPSKIHDPIGYDRYYAESNFWGWIVFIGLILFFFARGC